MRSFFRQRAEKEGLIDTFEVKGRLSLASDLLYQMVKAEFRKPRVPFKKKKNHEEIQMCHYSTG